MEKAGVDRYRKHDLAVWHPLFQQDMRRLRRMAYTMTGLPRLELGHGSP
jgi:hypothetical protein